MFDPPSDKDTTTEVADDAVRAVDTAIKAAYNPEAETPYYPDTEGGESITTEEDLALASRAEELVDWGLGLPT